MKTSKTLIVASLLVMTAVLWFSHHAKNDGAVSPVTLEEPSVPEQPKLQTTEVETPLVPPVVRVEEPAPPVPLPEQVVEKANSYVSSIAPVDPKDPGVTPKQLSQSDARVLADAPPGILKDISERGFPVVPIREGDPHVQLSFPYAPDFGILKAYSVEPTTNSLGGVDGYFINYYEGTKAIWAPIEMVTVGTIVGGAK